jgi:hypothetical protein
MSFRLPNKQIPEAQGGESIFAGWSEASAENNTKEHEDDEGK